VRNTKKLSKPLSRPQEGPKSPSKGPLGTVVRAALSVGTQPAREATKAVGWAAQAVGQRIEATRAPADVAELNAYAQRLLGPKSQLQAEVDRRLAQMGVEPARAVPLGEAYYIAFPDAVWTLADDQKSMRRAAEEVARFFVNAHVAQRGQPTEALRGAELLPFRETKEVLKLDAAEKKLEVGLKGDWRSLFTRIRVPKARELKRAWDAGKQFDSKALQRAWVLFNPTGEVRTTLTHVVAKPAETLAKHLLAIESDNRSFERKKAELLKIIGQNVNRDVASSPHSETKLATELGQRLGQLETADQLKAFISSYVSFLRDPGLLLEATAAVQQAVVSSDLRAKIRIEGGVVAVGNLHDVSVNAQFAINHISELERFVTTVEKSRDLDVEVKSKGVAVYTVDLVDVHATLDVMQSTAKQQRVLQTAALDRALDELRSEG
jgi:hypothetical protein